MATDGDIDYRTYPREELDQVLEGIDRLRYPLNYQHLIAEIERRRIEAQAAAATHAPAGADTQAPTATLFRPEFNADPREYFRIWIVNLALTIVTLGIYSAWAKVRKLRYFYSNTVLAGSAFGYHGEPLKILKGRIIAGLLAACYFAATRTSPIATLIVIALLAVATPWLVVKSRMFAMRVTSWRGLRFDFVPDYAGAYGALLGWLILGIVTLGILMPRFARERYRFIMSRSRFGATSFECNPGIGRFYKTTFVAFGLSVVIVMVVMMPATLLVHGLHLSGTARTVASTIPVVLFYVIFFSVIHAYTQSRNLNEVFSHTTLGAHRFDCRLGARDLMGIYLSNFILIVITLGLYTPWAQIRLARYRLEAIELEAHGSLNDFVAAAAGPVPAATGEELSSFLDLDFGF